MKFLVFSDFHYAPGWMSGHALGRNEEDLRKIQRIAKEESCDFIIHGGDFTHGPLKNTTHLIDEYNAFEIPSYHCLGNHETDQESVERVLSAYGLDSGYYYFDCNGYRIIVLDSNYYYIDGKYSHYSDDYIKGTFCGDLSCRDFLGPEQVLWLEETIRTSPYPCITISHQGFGREAHGVGEQEELRRIIAEANKRKKHSVLLCMNGHNHCDHLRIIDGVLYFEVNSASGYAIPKPHPHYPKEETEDATWMTNILAYDDILYAIVTVEGSTIDIRGTETTLHRDVTIEMTDSPKFEKMGRVCEPLIRSAKITIW